MNGKIAPKSIVIGVADPIPSPVHSKLGCLRRGTPEFGSISLFLLQATLAPLAAVEEDHVGAPCRERLHICRRSLPLCTRESALDGLQIVEVERRDQMKVGRAPRSCNRTLADLVLSETGDFLRDRNVLLEVVSVKSSKSFGALYITTSRAIVLHRTANKLDDFTDRSIRSFRP